MNDLIDFIGYVWKLLLAVFSNGKKSKGEISYQPAAIIPIQPMAMPAGRVFYADLIHTLDIRKQVSVHIQKNI